MRSWQRVAVAAALVAAIAAAGILANLTLLGLTQDANEPAGKLSPRAVFTQDGGLPAAPVTTSGGKGDASRPGHENSPDRDD